MDAEQDQNHPPPPPDGAEIPGAEAGAGVGGAGAGAVDNMGGGAEDITGAIRGFQDLLSTISRELETMSFGMTRQTAGIAANGENLVAHGAMVAEHTAVLRAVLGQLEQLNLTMRHESRSLESAVNFGFFNLQRTLQGHSDLWTAQNRIILEGIERFFQYMLERHGGGSGGGGPNDGRWGQGGQGGGGMGGGMGGGALVGA